MMTPAAGREAVAHLEQGLVLIERRDCSLIGGGRRCGIGARVPGLAGRIEGADDVYV